GTSAARLRARPASRAGSRSRDRIGSGPWPAWEAGPYAPREASRKHVLRDARVAEHWWARPPGRSSRSRRIGGARVGRASATPGAPPQPQARRPPARRAGFVTLSRGFLRRSAALHLPVLRTSPLAGT